MFYTCIATSNRSYLVRRRTALRLSEWVGVVTNSHIHSDTDWPVTVTVTARFRERQQPWKGHIICAYVCSIYQSSLLVYCLLCALFQPLILLWTNETGELSIRGHAVSGLGHQGSVIAKHGILPEPGDGWPRLANAEMNGVGRITENKKWRPWLAEFFIIKFIKWTV